MKKLSVLLVLCLCLVAASVASAAPMTDMTTGNFQVDLGVGWSNTSYVYNDSVTTHPGSNNVGVNAGLTLGLGNNFGARERVVWGAANTYPPNTTTTLAANTFTNKFDVVYNVANGRAFAANTYLGFASILTGTKTSYSTGAPTAYTTSSTQALFAGVEGVRHFGSFDVFGNVEASTAYYNAGIGVGMPLSKQFAVNAAVDYTYIYSGNNTSQQVIYPHVGVSFNL